MHTGLDGTDVVERVVKQGEKFDALLLDERLKVMNGSEACMFVREYEVDAHLPEMPIIAISANVEPDDLVHLVCPTHVSVFFWGSLWFYLALFGPSILFLWCSECFVLFGSFLFLVLGCKDELVWLGLEGRNALSDSLFSIPSEITTEKICPCWLLGGDGEADQCESGR